MNSTKYAEKKINKTDSYVAQQLSVLNQKNKEQDGIIKNLKAAIVEKGKIIATLNQEIQTLKERAAAKKYENI